MPPKRQAKRATPKINKADLQHMIEEATVDAYDLSEQVTGFHCMLDEHLETPFETEVLGVETSVESITLTDGDEIVAVCRRGKHKQNIRIVDLPMPTPPPAGWEWIQAYQHWVKGWR
jgi:hypothetical protein